MGESERGRETFGQYAGVGSGGWVGSGWVRLSGIGIDGCERRFNLAHCSLILFFLSRALRSVRLEGCLVSGFGVKKRE